MSRALVVLASQTDRRRVADLVMKAPINTRVEIKAAKRTPPQNDRMWAMLTECALQLPWDGARRTPDKWKLLFLDALRRELAEDEELLPSLDGSGGRVNVGNSTSDLSKDEMTMLIELMFKFGAEHGVVFHDQEEVAA